MPKLTKQQMKNKERSRKAAETRRRNREVNEVSKMYWEEPTPTLDNRTYSKPTITASIEDNNKIIKALANEIDNQTTALWMRIHVLEERINQLETRLG